jgi:hypothetical protein
MFSARLCDQQRPRALVSAICLTFFSFPSENMPFSTPHAGNDEVLKPRERKACSLPNGGSHQDRHGYS